MSGVDATYRSDLRELDAKIDRLAAALEAKLDRLAVVLDADRVTGEIRANLERAFREHNRWRFVAWVTLLIPLIGLWIRG